MRISLLAVGTRMPDWVTEGFDVYRRRLPRQLELVLEEIPAGRRKHAGDVAVATAKEGEELLRRASDADRVVALDEHGREWNTRELADRLESWQSNCRHVALLVGGADGLADACLEDADENWSLSRLTLPHALVRVLVAEQIYRAWTLLQGHPYHRG